VLYAAMPNPMPLVPPVIKTVFLFIPDFKKECNITQILLRNPRYKTIGVIYTVMASNFRINQNIAYFYLTNI
jgi:hypothetical protein